MNILHTSDWHIGRSLYGKKRYAEFDAFLTWLLTTIQDHSIRVLLVAGDIFDSSTPSNRAQSLYYSFLYRVAASSCRHVVIIAGNHDSPSFLNAPKELLKALDIHVIGNITDDPEDEVLVLYDDQDVPELLVCAVPYLRDRDIRVAEAGESIEDKEQKLLDGLHRQYAAVAAAALQKRRQLGADIPIVGMGHLFTSGGKTVDGDGVRELYIGSLAHVTARIFPPCFTYVALGHLHVPQMVGGLETIRYSGSPLPMGFGEAQHQKSVCRVACNGSAVSVQLIDVPVLQKLEQIRGDWSTIQSRIMQLVAADSRAWLEVIYEGDEVIGDLRERLQRAVAGTEMGILRIKNTRVFEQVLRQTAAQETLDDLNAEEVFVRCLEMHGVAEEQRPELLRTYRETLLSLAEDDVQAE
ncbi:exonuclease SbcCD subunit D C-terminal domain-containing protein [Desulfobulbus oligotrophicus]|uniref:Nuclease SbcCD subunit D n=1 Tax=Desulfobulbus oligotrophicus TaxID=1909699 RepID=A0A7T5VF46_9BACT|nr:exonuclease SbcCD subunit D C-terminal domain-containing protein [Desulfobulbus oligotrophicus]QQG66775.1 exonuclease SbcCD subunit D C-terminal domain-containing protein [Desulfobulbus oligotrophicus]